MPNPAIRAGLDERGPNGNQVIRVEGLTEDLDGTPEDNRQNSQFAMGPKATN